MNTTIRIYDVIEKIPEKKFRLYVDGDWSDEYATLEEAEEEMNKWINNEGLDNTPDGLEWNFDEICVIEIVKMKILEEVECERNRVWNSKD